MYTVKDISQFLNVDFGFIRRILESNKIRPYPLYGRANEKYSYCIHQLLLLKPQLEQVSGKNLHFDLDKKEIFIEYNSTY